MRERRAKKRGKQRIRRRYVSKKKEGKAKLREGSNREWQRNMNKEKMTCERDEVNGGKKGKRW